MLNTFYETERRGHVDRDVTIVLDAVGVDEADICKEHFSVLVFVFGDVLLNHNTQTEQHFLLDIFTLLVLLAFKVDSLFKPYLTDALQIHGVYNHLIIIRNKLFVDRMMKWPGLWKGKGWRMSSRS